MTGGPGKEHGTNKPPPTGKVQERSKGDTTGLTTSQNPSLASILAEQGMHHQEGLRMNDQDNTETYPFTIKPVTASHVAE